MDTITQRVEKLRAAMQQAGVSAYIVPGTDPHASEYVAPCWKEREWISGFSGSAGAAVITANKAAVWTDSRYFLQATAELENTGFVLMKQGLPETPTLEAWLRSELKKGESAGINPQMLSFDACKKMKDELAIAGIELVMTDLIAALWTNRPPLPAGQAYIYNINYAGISAAEKLTAVRNEMTQAHADTLLLAALDDIAWLLNIRGADVDFNPVVVAYALITKTAATLFVANGKLSPETKTYLKNQGVAVKPYEAIYTALSALKTKEGILLDGAKINQSLFEAIPAETVVRNVPSPVVKLKAIKNETEKKGTFLAMEKDGVALVKFFKWLEENAGKTAITELLISQKLHDFRAEQPHFTGESFATIAAWGAHGAIVHYGATPQTDVPVTKNNLLLLDSGAQYLEGTTDITRTVALGTPTVQQKNDFTLVLKGHIALATAVFPAGTRGSQLDILARKALWDRHINYGHGTGHGVGHFLCVHEGPQSIRMEENSTALQEGMITSNEPGIYRTGEYGIRIENLVLVRQAGESNFGKFLCFETLTLFPIDLGLININLLTQEEILWLNNYHARVYERLIPALSEDEREWLSRKCKPLA